MPLYQLCPKIERNLVPLDPERNRMSRKRVIRVERTEICLKFEARMLVSHSFMQRYQ